MFLSMVRELPEEEDENCFSPVADESIVEENVANESSTAEVFSEAPLQDHHAIVGSNMLCDEHIATEEIHSQDIGAPPELLHSEASSSMGLNGEALSELLQLLTAAATAEPQSYRRASSGNLHMTCYDAVSSVIKPTTEAMRVSYAQHIMEHPSDDASAGTARVGAATVFVSHAWKTNIFSVLNSVLAYDDARKSECDKDSGTAYYWIDLCCVNQHQHVGATTMEQWKDRFSGALTRASQMVVVMAPFDDPFVCRRAWCLLEMFWACRADIPMEFVIPPAEQASWEHYLREHLESVSEVYLDINSANAEATEENDLSRIRQLMLEVHASGVSTVMPTPETTSLVGTDAPPYGVVDAAVVTCIRSWLLGVAEGLLAQMCGQHMPSSASEATADFACEIGKLLHQAGQYERSLQHYQQALDIYLTTNGGESHPGVATTYTSMGCACRDAREYNLALEYLEKALLIRKMALGDMDPTVATVLWHLGCVYLDMEKYGKTIELFQEAVGIKIIALGDRHADIATVYDSLGVACLKSNNTDGAVEYLEKALTIKQGVFGEAHVDTAKSLMLLGSALLINNVTGSIDCFQHALRVKVTALGSGHPEVGDLHVALGSAFFKARDYVSAMRAYEQAYTVLHNDIVSASTVSLMAQSGGSSVLHKCAIACYKSRVFDRAIVFFEKEIQRLETAGAASNAAVAVALSSIGTAYYKLGDIEKAIAHYSSAIQRFSDSGGGSKHQTQLAATYHSLGNAYCAIQEHTRAIASYEKEIECTRSRASSATSKDGILKTYLNLATACVHANDVNRAIRYYEEARSLQIDVVGPTHALVGNICANLGRLYHDTGSADKAIEFYEQALAITTTVGGENHPDVGLLNCHLAQAYKSRNDFDRAIQHYTRALSVRRELFGEHHADVAAVHDSLALAHRSKGDFDKAIECYASALTCRKAAFGADHPIVATTSMVLGNSYVQVDAYDDAINCYKRALDIRISKWGKDPHLEVAESYKALGDVYVKKTTHENALQPFLEAVTMLSTLLGETHKTVVEIHRAIAGVYEILGDHTQAKEYLDTATRAEAQNSDVQESAEETKPGAADQGDVAVAENVVVVEKEEHTDNKHSTGTVVSKKQEKPCCSVQ
eukprot:m.1260884 g.1260884  ORF g.1260884 m.1260884 type:complete len:1123 (+) comp24729_c0_seq8:536-3904(+)